MAGDLCSLLFQLVKKLSDLTGCTQVVDVGSGQVSQTPNVLGFCRGDRTAGRQVIGPQAQGATC